MQVEKTYLSAAALVVQLKERGASLPFSRSSLEKDRMTGCLGGIPFRRVGGLCIYDPDEVLAFIAGLPVIQPQRHPALIEVSTRRRGNPQRRVCGRSTGSIKPKKKRKLRRNSR